MVEDLPNHLISRIFHEADLDIDTRRALRIRPGSVKRVMSSKAYSTLLHLCDARSKMWVASTLQTGRKIVGCCSSPMFTQEVQGRKQLSVVTIYVWDYGVCVMMRVDRLGYRLDIDEAFVIGSVFCDVQTGNLVP